jgi:hypothetical protein
MPHGCLSDSQIIAHLAGHALRELSQELRLATRKSEASA